MKKLTKICEEGFHFSEGSLVWVVPLPEELPEGAVVTGSSLEDLALFYELDESQFEVSYSQEQVDSAEASIG